MDLDGEELSVNEYYHKNPNRIAGRLVSRKGRYGAAKEMAVESTEIDPNEAIRELFRDLAKGDQIDKNLGQPQSSSQAQSPREQLLEELDKALDSSSKVPFSNVPAVSELYFEVERLSDLDSQVRDLSSAREADELREQVHAKYSDTVSKIGMSLHAMIHERRIERDARATKQILSLETHFDVEQNRKSSIKDRRYIASGVLTRSREAEILKRQAAIESTKTIQEAVNVSRNERGSIDVALVAKSLKVEPEEATQQMLDSGLAFAVPVDYENPEIGGETLVGREEFLSGNLGLKIDVLEEMLAREEFDDPEIKERYIRALDSLKEALPKPIPKEELIIKPTHWKTGVLTKKDIITVIASFMDLPAWLTENVEKYTYEVAGHFGFEVGEIEKNMGGTFRRFHDMGVPPFRDRGYVVSTEGRHHTVEKMRRGISIWKIISDIVNGNPTSIQRKYVRPNPSEDPALIEARYVSPRSGNPYWDGQEEQNLSLIHI